MRSDQTPLLGSQTGESMIAANAVEVTTMLERSPLQRVLADAFGFEGLRPGQGDIIGDILDGRPTLAVMPTGAGKSLCYQLPAVVLGERGGVTLVVSPLIALMKDQVDALTARGIPAAALTSAASPDQQRDILEGRPSELESQTGAVVRLAAQAGLSVPANSFLYASLLPSERRARIGGPVAAP